MKEKRSSRREKIINEALLLFADKGYADTSTKLIATQANVSEALIFKHFGNKDQLLIHLIKSGYRRVLSQNKGMLTYQNPRVFLQNMIDLPKKLVNEEPLFWKLQERLSHHEFSRQQQELFMKPVHPVIERAFVELGYVRPELETQFLLLIIEMLWKKAASGEIKHIDHIITLVKDKYGL